MRKTPNELTNNFSSKYFLDFLAALLIFNALARKLNDTETILFALLNQKITYN